MLARLKFDGSHFHLFSRGTKRSWTADDFVKGLERWPKEIDTGVNQQLFTLDVARGLEAKYAVVDEPVFIEFGLYLARC